MSGNKPNGHDRSRHNGGGDEAKEKAEDAASPDATFWESEDLPPEVAEEFLQNVIAYEQAEWTTHLQQLERAGVELPLPEAMSDEELTAKLWEVIHALARMRVFLSSTDHLDDRQLYTHLWSDSLREEIPQMPFDQFSAWHLDLVGSGSDEDNYIYLKYYADEESRQWWMRDFPDYDMPAHEDAPYDRDRLLPQPDREPPNGEEKDEPLN
jgi:hypothetical protein